MILLYGLTLRFPFNPSQHVATMNEGSLLGSNLYKTTANACGNGDELAPRCLYVAQNITFLVLLSDEWFEAGYTLVTTLKLIEDLSVDGTYHSVGFCMLEGS